MSSPLLDRLRAAFGSSLRQPTADPEPPHVAARPAEPLPGVELQTADGPCLVYEERLPLEHLHGDLPLGTCLALPPRALAYLIRRPDLGPVDLRQAVFLDTETTGLAGGTGTSAFLVGLGHFETEGERRETDGDEGTATPASSASACRLPPSCFVIRQFFMRDFGEERALLLALAEALAPFRYVVTFNGKSFDLPLLETRFILARLPRRWRPELHFDLLHPARRLWRERLTSCTLGTLEEAVLGHRREADVPSWAIPGLYAAFLQGGPAGPLRRVFSHNRLDLLSLAGLLAQLGHRLAAPLEGRLGPDELLAIGRLYDELGLAAEAYACLEAAHGAAEPPLRERAALLLAQAARRSGRRDRAVELWQQLSRGPAALTGLTELAKHHEHQRRDPATALDLVEQALTVLELREARDGPLRWRVERADLERRLARLLRKRGLGVDWRAGTRPGALAAAVADQDRDGRPGTHG